MKHLAMALTTASLLLAGNAWAEGCMHAYSQEAKEAKLMASAATTPKMMLWQLRGLDDAKRARLVGKAPIESIVPVHN